MQLADGTEVRKIAPYGVQGTPALIQGTRQITFEPRPVSPEVACAHCELGAPRTCVVMAERGPRGGYPWIKFDRDPIPHKLRKLVNQKCELYLGWVQDKP